MTHGGEKRTFGTAALFSRLFGLAQRLLGLLALSDILRHADNALDFPLMIAHDRGRKRHWDTVPTLGRKRGFHTTQRTVVHEAVKPRLLGDKVGWQNHGKWLAKQFCVG